MKFEQITIGYKDKTLFESVCFEICDGDCIMLCGANGSGKTTLLKTIAATAEDMGIEAVMIPARVTKVTGFTLREYVRICCYRQSDSGGLLSESDEKAMDDALKELDLLHLDNRDISTLSDGEFQKASIVSALVRKARILLLDEPTAFLDAENRIAILKALQKICVAGRQAVVFSTHDLHDGLKAANKVFALGADGQFRSSTKDMEETVKTIFF